MRVALVLVPNNVMVGIYTELEEEKDPVLDAIDSNHRQILLLKLATTIESIVVTTTNSAEAAF